MDSILEIKNLSVNYVTDDGVVRAVNALDLRLNPGETLGLVGETGAGKTTTAKAVLRLLPHPQGRVTGGEILFHGKDLLALPAKEMRNIRGSRISMIFQDPMTSLNPVLTVGEQITEVIRLHQKLSRIEADRRAKEMLELVGIKVDRFGEYPHQFSGGMKQRVGIAMALACNPQLLIADEPTSALDVTKQAQVLELMKRLRERYGTSLIMITHDLGIVAEICDYVAIMYAGQDVEYAEKRELFRNPLHPYTVGLFGCIPDLTVERNELIPIPGMMPNPTEKAEGCPFAPRCPDAAERCRREAPPMVQIHEGHRVRCFKHMGGEC